MSISMAVNVVLLGFFFLHLCAADKNNQLSKHSTHNQHHLHNKEAKLLLQKQVGHELNASTVYLTMAAHFGSEKHNRPGFTQFFRKCAQEEFEHAQMFIDYMNKRGIPWEKSEFGTVLPEKFEWEHGLEALEDALKMEGQVTELIKTIHEQAGDDGHLTNFLESEFLEEQVDSMRRLAGYVQNLGSMTQKNNKADNKADNNLAEYLFDLQLQGKKVEL